MFLAETTTPEMVTIDWNVLINTLINWCMTTGIKFVLGILVLIVLFKIINASTRRLYKTLHKRHVDETIAKVVSSSIKVFLKVLILIMFIGYIGIETASISAVIASIGVGVSLAVQGALSNFAGGLIIIIMRPFKIGDWITTNGESGSVENIKLFYTEIVTGDNKVVHVPNGSLANNVIVNVSAKETRRVDMVFSVSYDTDLTLAKQILANMLANDERVFTDPAPFITVSEYAASSINITVRAWTKSSNYWGVYWNMMNNVKSEFDKAGIEIPFNQLDVNIRK
jgi:small conductance mechanosensitive channel